MLDQHQCIAAEIDWDAARWLGCRLSAPVPAVGIARPDPPAADGHRRRYYRIKLPSKLELQEPVKIVHLY